MAFSGGVKLGDLDDFIGLSQECIIPLFNAAEGGAAKFDLKSDKLAATKAVEVLVQKPNLIKTKKSTNDPKAEIAGVSLSDCLACSGCVTSAETVLLQQQSGEEFLKRVKTAPLTVVSISAEARTSLAAHLGIPPLLALRKIAAVLQRHGATYVLESSAADAIALLEGKAEFIRRFRPAQTKCKPSEKLLPAALPLLTSHCPGWTCYAEKVVDPIVLPYLAPLKPPQQVQGRLVKTCLLEAHNRRMFYRGWRAHSPLFMGEAAWWHSSVRMREMHNQVSFAEVYHVSVQPCFDRKLEAARPNFQVAGDGEVCEVDTILTTSELLDLCEGSGSVQDSEVSIAAAVCDLIDVMPVALESEVLTDLMLNSLSQIGRRQPLLCAVHGNAGSGGFVEHVFREAAKELFQIDVAPSLELKTKQNEDMREVVLHDSATKKVLLRFVSAYGFRNIQNVIRRLTKVGAAPTVELGHFVEVMACPGGCLNGGGQIPAPKRKAGDALTQAGKKERLNGLESALCHSDDTAIVPPAEHPLVLPLYRFIAKNASTPEATTGLEPLEQLVGGSAVQQWLSAQWRSLKVDSEGKAVIGASALKW